MLDTVREAESFRALPHLVNAIINVLQSGEPAMNKDSLEFQFRRVLLEIMNRLPVNEALKPSVPAIFKCMLMVLRTDHEENGVTACKAMVDTARGYRAITDDLLADFLTLMMESFRNVKEFIPQVLSEDSPLLDVNTVIPSIRSPKVLGEMSMVMVIMSQVYRPAITTIQSTISHAFDLLALESPAQHSARTNYEAMGGIWAGTASTIKNSGVYSDLIHAQIKVGCSFLTFLVVCVCAHVPRCYHIWHMSCDLREVIQMKSMERP